MLTAVFNHLNEDGLKKLALSIRHLAQNLYASNHNLRIDQTSRFSVLIVCVLGDYGAGKSTLSKELLYAGLDAVSAKGDGGNFMMAPTTHDLDGGREVLVWQSMWSDVTGQQNRVRDCLLTEPYNCSFTMNARPIPGRILPGMEILEHGRLVPLDLRALTIKVDIEQTGHRQVQVTLQNPEDNILDDWEEFKLETRWAALAL